MAPTHVVVRHATLHAGPGTVLYPRDLMVNLLEAVPTTPGHLPSTALLVVRRLRFGGKRAGIARERATDAWRRTVAAEINRVTRSATRPADGVIPPDCAAVWFADSVELLTCLSNDLAKPSSLPWWWAVLAGRGGRPLEWLTDAFDRVPQAVPVAMESLARAGLAPRLLSMLGDGAAGRILDSVLRAYDLSPSVAREEQLRRGLEPSDAGLGGSLGRPDMGFAGVQSQAAAVRQVADLESLLAMHVPEILTCCLPPQSRLLLAVSLALARAHTEFCRRWFAVSAIREQAGASWKRGYEFVEIGLPTPPSDGRNGRSADRRRREGVAVVDAPTTFSSRHDLASHRSGTTSLPPNAHDEGMSTEQRWAIDPGPVGSTGDVLDDTQPRRPIPSQPRVATQTQTPSLTRESIRERGSAANQLASGLLPKAGDDPIDTAFGGLFYAINVALRLGLYGDFTAPRQPGLPFSLFDVLGMIAVSVLGEELRRDPLWAALGSLAGYPAADEWDPCSDVPDAWFVPDHALTALDQGSGVWRWQTAKHRLQVLHPAGFLAADVPWPGRASTADARRLVERFHQLGSIGSLRRSTRLMPECSGNAWLGGLTSLFRAFVAAAIHSPGNPDALLYLVRRKASVHLTPTRLDIHFSLDEHPIEIRIAGLDRDPGWIPAAGRTIAFHYD